MSSFILQLLIISAFGLMVQSAPVNDVTKRSTDKKETAVKLENSLYCAAECLYQRGNFILPQPNIDNCNNTTIIANKIFNHFSDRCKNFTKVMTFKHQLQEHIFNDSTSSQVLNSDNAKHLSIILTSLQLLVNTFNEIELNENNSMCVELTPAQYRIMYCKQNTLLKSWNDIFVNWYLGDDLYPHGGKHCPWKNTVCKKSN